MTFVVFDLHTRDITACALDESGTILAEIRLLATSLETALAWLAALPQPVTVGMEATLYWEWLVTRLTKAEHTVQVAHAFHVKLIWQARAKTYPIDARTLAELSRAEVAIQVGDKSRESYDRCAVHLGPSVRWPKRYTGEPAAKTHQRDEERNGVARIQSFPRCVH